MANVRHEEPPKAQSSKEVIDTPFDYILVQVTQNDINAGENKIHRMQRDGWELCPDKHTHADDYHYMQKPKTEVKKLEQIRLDQYKKWMDASYASEHGGPNVNLGTVVEKTELGDDNMDSGMLAKLNAAATQRSMANG